MHGSAEILILFYDLWSKTIISFISYQSGLVPEDFTTDNEGWGGIIPCPAEKKEKKPVFNKKCYILYPAYCS